MVSESFPRSELFGLTSQIRRSSVSVMANIAEGTGRSTSRDIAQFLFVARGSAHETMCHVIIASDLGYLETSIKDELVRRYKGLAIGIFAYAKSMNSSHGQVKN